MNIIKLQNYVEFFIDFDTFLRVNYIMLEPHTVVNFTSNEFEIGISFPKDAY